MRRQRVLTYICYGPGMGNESSMIIVREEELRKRLVEVRESDYVELVQ